MFFSLSCLAFVCPLLSAKLIQRERMMNTWELVVSGLVKGGG